jgi:peroxiredoxin
MSGNAWVCTIITGILLLSGAEQAIRALNPEPEPPPPAPQPVGPQLGDYVPRWSLPDERGKTFTSAQFLGKPLVVNFYCGCSRCEVIAKQMTAWQKKNRVPMVGLVTFKPEYFQEFRDKTDSEFPLLIDEGKEVGKQWASEICPRVWVVDGQGRAVWTNPQEPDLMDPAATVNGVKQAWAKPVIPTQPNQPPVAKTPGTAG